MITKCVLLNGKKRVMFADVAQLVEQLIRNQ